MSRTAFRAALMERIVTWSAQHPGVEIYYENGPVPDLDRVSDVWIDIELRWYGAATVAMGERPRGRASGALAIRIFRREATGTAVSDVLVDQLEELFRPQRIGGGLLDFPEALTPTDLLGWPKVGLLVPFTIDRA